MLIAGLGGRFGNHNRDQIPALWMRWGPKYFGQTPGQVDRRTYGVCSNMDDKGNLDYCAGVEVSSFEGLPAELTQLTIAPAALRRLSACGPHIDDQRDLDGHIRSVAADVGQRSRCGAVLRAL